MATKVADVLVEFSADDKDLKNASKEATTSLNSLGAEGEKSAGRFSGAFKAAAGAVAALSAAAVTAIAGLVVESTKLYSELEQNMGGVEAVFGEGYTDIAEHAYDAYKTMGLSASDYMATANKMGSLFQGSGIEQSKAMDMTTDAMQRAADVASVMGIDMEMAMESIAGAAKGNFTMMDNLGVSMNATAIEAYALEKGINFTWNTASQAEKAELAMQMFMDRTSQYAGNFAKESEQTISGSIGMMRASWENLLAAFADPNQAGLENMVGMFVDSLSAVADNILPVIENVLTALTTALPPLVEKIVPILVEVLNQAISILATVLPTLIPILVTGFLQLFMSIAEALPQIIPPLISGITLLITQLARYLPTLIPLLLESAILLFMSIAEALPEIVTALTDALPLVVDSVISLLTDPSLIVQLLEAAIMLFMSLVEALPEIVTALTDAIPKVINSVISLLPTLVPLLLSAAVKLFFALVSAAFQIGSSLLGAVGQILMNLPKNILLYAQTLFGAGKALFQGLIDGIRSLASNLLNVVLGPIKNAVAGVKSFLGIHSPSKTFAYIGKMSGEGLVDGIVGMSKAAANAATSLAGAAVSATKGGLSKIGRLTSDAISGKTNLGSMTASLNIGGAQQLRHIGSSQTTDTSSSVNRNQPLIGQIIVPDGADPMAFAQYIGAQVRFA